MHDVAAQQQQGAPRESSLLLNKPLPIHAQARTVAEQCLRFCWFLLSAWVAFEFLPSLAWAGILAIATWPVYEARWGHLSKENLPYCYLWFYACDRRDAFCPRPALQQLASQSEPLTKWLTELREQGIPVPGWVGQLPIAGEYLAEWWRSNLTDGAAREPG
jgi:hypothetical protein